MRPATRMQTIGTETAFEVSARARALEATGPRHHPPPDRRARLRHARERPRGGEAGARRRRDPLRALPGHPGAARGDRRRRHRPQGLRGHAGPGLRHGRWQGRDALRDPRPDRPGRRGRSSRTPATRSTSRSSASSAARPFPIPIRMENDFRLDVDELASLVTPRTRMIVINSPANPTGGVLTRARPRARSPSSPSRHDLVVLADEIYGRILYDGAEHVSIASLPGMAERTIVLDGFSKTFAMTGWRLGYAIVPPSLVQIYGQLVINTISCAPTFAQVGAVEALRGPQDDDRRDGRGVPRPARPHRRRPERDPRHPLPLARPARSTCSRTSRARG